MESNLTVRRRLDPPGIRPLLLVLCGAVTAFLLGCHEDEEIRRIQVPKQEPLRLLAVIVPQPGHTWFFKLVGPFSQVAEHQKEFDDFLHSVHFTKDDKDPITWNLPAGWRQGPPEPLRYATFLLGPENAPLQVTVHQFGSESGKVLPNVNRWRNNDLGLPPITRAELARYTHDTQVDGASSQLVDMTAAANESVFGAPPPTPAPLTYTRPKGWKKKGPDPKGLYVLAFSVSDNSGAAETTVTPAGGSLLDNVNRWRTQQLGLEAVDEDQLHKDLQQIEVDGFPAQYVDLQGAEDPGQPRQSIVGVLIPRGDMNWVVIRMKGPADLVQRQKSVFDAFVKSIHFTRGGGEDE
ncbi:MAG: hypothetical protein JO112_03240 [Planctomycetes bacterium]|nr:hypothetical protein [Planctomycetota bacterium]